MAHEHLEHAEHAGHAADPFDRRVAVSVAVVAALLAGISMLGHRKHNEVLQLQGDANRLTTQASILHTQATDKWGEYQAVNVRDHGYEFSGKLLGEISSAKPESAPRCRSSSIVPPINTASTTSDCPASRARRRNSGTMVRRSRRNR